MSLIFCGDLTLPFGINIDIPVGGINLVHT